MAGITPNPGGNIAPKDAIGRTALIDTCWKILKHQSIRLENERRSGKTTLIRALVANAPANTRTIFTQVGGVTTITGFIETLISDVDRVIPERSRTFANQMRQFMKLAGGFEVGTPGVTLRIPEGMKAEWRDILLRCFREIQDATSDRIVFFWDELPWMLQTIKRDAGEDAAIALLNTLRDVRQMHDSIRMVFAGSIGFHHVISAFEKGGRAVRPLSDMKRINVPPLTRIDGKSLAQQLLLGINGDVNDMDATTTALYELTGGVAFYIHQVVGELDDNGNISPESVSRKTMEMLTRPDDPWDMRHFSTRLETYYGEATPVARKLLDMLAQSEAPLSLTSLQEGALSLDDTFDRQRVLDMLRDLMRDHYIDQEQGGERKYSFLYPLLKRWWRLERELA